MEWGRKRWNEIAEEEWNGGGRGGMKWRKRKGMGEEEVECNGGGMEWERKRWNEIEEEEWNGEGRGGMKWRRRNGMGEEDVE